MTLDDLVVFSEVPESHESIEWWAHELYHVYQYQKWSVEGFALRYIKDWGAVEEEAKEKAAEIADLINRRLAEGEDKPIFD